jgi:hypothetical protein
MDGYFKVHRKILESQVFAHQTALKIWIWCLAKVTYKERFVALKIGKGETTVKLLPGQFLFGRFKAEEELNIDGSTIYKWIQKFASEDFGMINIESNNQYSVITICNWEQYQNDEDINVTTKEQPSNNQVTAEGQPSNNQVTHTIKYNNVKKEKNDNKYIDNGELNSLFVDFLEMRKKIKKPATERAIELLLKDLNKINDKRGALELSIKKNYQGLFEPNNKTIKHGLQEKQRTYTEPQTF